MSITEGNLNTDTALEIENLVNKMAETFSEAKASRRKMFLDSTTTLTNNERKKQKDDFDYITQKNEKGKELVYNCTSQELAKRRFINLLTMLKETHTPYAADTETMSILNPMNRRRITFLHK